MRSKKREYFDDRLTRFLNSTKHFFNELNRLTGRQKKKSNFIIADNKIKLNTDDCAVSNVFNEKFVSISKTSAYRNEGLFKHEKSLFFYPTDSLEISKIVRNPRNHKAAGLDGLTAEILKVSLDVICDSLT